ncbi:MAG: MBL fold metallo-hydrolase, partial [Anaerolineae bacterium]
KFRSPGNPFHPQEAGHVGFIVTLGGQRIYHAGDTDNIPEMDNLQVDIALLPVSGTYVMTAEEAADAAQRIAPRVTIPMHYGAGVAGTRADAERFGELYGGQVVILEQE